MEKFIKMDDTNPHQQPEVMVNMFPVFLIPKTINMLLSENSILNSTDFKNIERMFFMRKWDKDGLHKEIPIKLFEDVMKEIFKNRHKGMTQPDILKSMIESRFNKPDVLPEQFYRKLEGEIFKEISNEDINGMRTAIVKNVEQGATLSALPALEEIVNRIKLASFDERDNIVTEAKSVLKSVTENLTKIKKPSNKLEDVILTPTNIGDLSTHVHAELNRKNRKLRTGIKGFDYLTGGGFEPGTANLIGASTGNGKSLTLLNFTEGIAKANKASDYETSDRTKKPLIVYISFENIQQMTFLRLCKLITNKDKEVVKETEPNVIQQEVSDYLKDSIPIKIVYAPSYTVSVDDLDNFCTGNVDEDGNEYETIAVVCDYLALLKQPQNSENHRLGLSMTQRNLADYATINNLVEISATQLNTESDMAPKLTRSAINESRAILDHVDNCWLFRKHSFVPGVDSLGESFSFDEVDDPRKVTFLETYSIKSRSNESPDKRIIIPMDDENGFKIARSDKPDFIERGIVSMNDIDAFLNKKFKITSGKVNERTESNGNATNIPSNVLPKIDGGSPYGDNVTN